MVLEVAILDVRAARWRELLHHSYDPIPAVEHYAVVPAASAAVG